MLVFGLCSVSLLLTTTEAAIVEQAKSSKVRRVPDFNNDMDY